MYLSVFDSSTQNHLNCHILQIELNNHYLHMLHQSIKVSHIAVSVKTPDVVWGLGLRIQVRVNVFKFCYRKFNAGGRDRQRLSGGAREAVAA
jgi:hypothetical protein